MPLQKLALIGARGHTHFVWDALPELPQVKVVGVADGAPDDPAAPLVKWCNEHGQAPRAFDDYRKMLDALKPDAVVVNGPFQFHAQMSIDAIERGMHVLAEKPLALNFDELARLEAACRAHPQVHLVGMMGARYDPGIHTAWQLIQQGAIGDARLFNARKSYRLGKRPAFYRKRDEYGGTIPWVGSHAIDWVMWMSGHKITSISATHSTVGNQDMGTMERSAACMCAMEGGRAATFSIDVMRPENAPTHGDDWTRVVGTDGVIEAKHSWLSLINKDNDGTKPIPVKCERKLFRDFVDQVDGRRPGLIDTRQTLVLTEVLLLARKAADEGIFIQIDPKKSLRF